MDHPHGLLDLLETRLIPETGRCAVIRGEPRHPRRMAKLPPSPDYMREFVPVHIMPEICRVTAGSMALVHDDRCYRLERGDFCLVPRLLRHYESYVRPDCPYTVLWFRFMTHTRLFVVSAGYTPGIGYTLHFGLQCDVPAITINRFFIGKEYARRTRRQTRDSLRALCSLVAGRIRQQDYVCHRVAGRGKSWKYRTLYELRDQIDQQPAAQYTIRSLARRLDVTPNHFTFLFRQEFGSGVLEYIIYQRLYAALDLLMHADLSIKQVAARLLFSDLAYFSRLFKKYYGLSPREFRTAYRQS
jgi:AraC-like DNA-binding protein